MELTFARESNKMIIAELETGGTFVLEDDSSKPKDVWMRTDITRSDDGRVNVVKVDNAAPGLTLWINSDTPVSRVYIKGTISFVPPSTASTKRSVNNPCEIWS